MNGEPSARVVLRPIASPLALGFVGLAMATTMLSALQLSWVPAAQQRGVAIALLGFVAPLQGLASAFGFRGRDTVVATGMGILSGSDGRLRLVSATSTRRARRRRLDCRPYARPRGGHRDSRRPHW